MIIMITLFKVSIKVSIVTVRWILNIYVTLNKFENIYVTHSAVIHVTLSKCQILKLQICNIIKRIFT